MKIRLRARSLASTAFMAWIVLGACRQPFVPVQASQTKEKEKEKEKEDPEKKSSSDRRPPRIRTLRPGGGRLDWCYEKDLIAFDAVGKDKYFDVHVMKSDGTSDRCVTCDVPGLPRRHVGQPAFHPSCRYLVVQAEKQDHIKIRFDHALTPGAGVLNDLWLIDLEKNTPYALRQVADARGTGTLHPHFSKDGTKLSWSEMEEKAGISKHKEIGYWKLMVADFSIQDGKPRLENVRSFAPGGDGFYENHGFSPDGRKIIYSSNVEAKRFQNHIYVMDLESGKATRLTDEAYNEHAIYSPDGKHIVWITTAENKGGTDYWIMNADGSGKKRLTFFNKKGHPDYAGRKIVVADFSWSPDGKKIAGYYRVGGALESVEDEIQIVTVDLSDEESLSR